MLLARVIADYVSARKGEIQPKTAIWYEAKLLRMAGWFADRGLTDVRKIRLEDLEAYRNHLMDCEITPQTVDGYIRCIRTFFKWLKGRGKIRVDPAIDLKRPKVPDVPPKRISKENVVALLRSAMGAGRVDLVRNAHFENIRDYALMRFFLMTGARRGGVVGLCISDIRIEDYSARVHEKGNKSRTIYYDPDTAAALQDYLDVRPATSHEYLWVTRKGKRLKEVGIRQIIKRICERAGLPDYGAHRLRHTFAFESVDAGADPDQLREQLGHSHLSTTYKHYVRWQSEQRKQTFSKSWLGDLKDPANAKPKLRLLKKTGGE